VIKMKCDYAEIKAKNVKKMFNGFFHERRFIKI